MAYRPGMALTSASPDLTGRRALVTGGTRGIGAATARRLADAGAEVVVAARTVPAAAEFPVIAADLSTAEGVATVSRRTLELLGGLDILVSNAGGQTHHPEGVLGFSDEDWQRDLDINLMAAVRLDWALLPALAKTGQGAIVHVGSGAARLTHPASLPYSAAKAALVAYSNGLAREAGPRGVRINLVSPGVIRTTAVEHFAVTAGRDVDEFVGEIVDAMDIPLGRAGTTDEAAQLIVFLVSPAAAYISGTQVTIDGGAMPTV